MTRIIAGFAGSLPLAVPKSGTRPTSDRVREAMFSSLQARDAITGARVADLYAGSGALGLEAVSRGAVSVVLVEKHKAAAACCRRNVQALLRAPRGGAPAPQIRVAESPVAGFLAAQADEFDLVFLDPPYDAGEAELTSALERLTLAPDATVVVERSSRSPEPAWPEAISLVRRSAYGETVLWWAEPA